MNEVLTQTRGIDGLYTVRLSHAAESLINQWAVNQKEIHHDAHNDQYEI